MKAVVFSRGFGKLLLEKGLSLTEDHLAAVVSHELEHEETKERLGPQSGEWLGMRRGASLQSEELRADAAGMERLARAGYNPRAMIEVYRAIGLTVGRYDRKHP